VDAPVTVPRGRSAARPESGALAASLKQGVFTVTAELTPPVAASPQPLLALAAPLRGRVDAINVTDAAGARTTMSSFAAAAILAREGFEAVVQVTCRDRNRIAIAGDLIGAAAQGVRNVLVLHGDDPKGGDMPDAKPVQDLDSKGVIRMARAMCDAGALPSGRTIDPPPRLLLGAADAPFDPPPDWQPTGLLAKAEAGADFVQTQFCFDARVVARYMARLAEADLAGRPSFLIGVGPLASAGSARWMNENLFGVHVPEAIIARLEGAADPMAEGKRICVELIEALREVRGVAGVHIMAPRLGPEVIAEVIEDAGLGPAARRAAGS
jgi:methylenetetrahydrofolate reductase (NADPH)